MPIAAVILVLISCLLHAVWNLLLKQARDKMAFTALYLLASSVIYFPLFLWQLPNAHIPPAGWACILGTGLLYVGYFRGLAVVYSKGELSIAYPIMRGLGPMLVLVGGMALMSERPSAAGLAGISVIMASLIALQKISGMQEGRLADSSKRGQSTMAAALFVGVVYSLYSMVDKVAVGQLQIPPPIYLYLTYAVSSIFVLPSVVLTSGWSAIKDEWAANKRASVAVGGLSVFSYLLVLYAMSLPGAPVSYITPLRTTSVLFGMLLGAVVLNEGRLAPKLAAGALMMCGITLIAWKG